MLRILGPSDLEGYLFQSPGGPQCELLFGKVVKTVIASQVLLVSLCGYIIYDGMKKWYIATVIFQDRGPDRRMLHTRLIAAGVCNGAYLTILAMRRNDKRIALDFKYSGLWRLKGYMGEKNVLVGKYTDLKIKNDHISIRFLDYNAARKCYYRRTVDISEEKLPMAKECFIKANKNVCICVCGPECRDGDMPIYNCEWFEIIDTSMGNCC